MSNFSCSLTNNSTSHSMENLAFHNSLRWKMIALPILTTSLIHFLSKRFGECTFWELGSGRVNYPDLLYYWNRRYIKTPVFVASQCFVLQILTSRKAGMPVVLTTFNATWAIGNQPGQFDFLGTPHGSLWESQQPLVCEASVNPGIKLTGTQKRTKQSNKNEPN